MVVHADTYIGYKIHWTRPDVAEFTTIFEYQILLEGKPVFEHRVTRLRLGQRLNEIEVFFSSSKSRGARPLAGFNPEIAIGLVTQWAEAKLFLEPGPRSLAMYEPFAGGPLVT